jgi:hypothetical protein
MHIGSFVGPVLNHQPIVAVARDHMTRPSSSMSHLKAVLPADTAKPPTQQPVLYHHRDSDAVRPLIPPSGAATATEARFECNLNSTAASVRPVRP